MRIAQVAPLYESVPPHLYGGTERVVSWLTEELVREGHQVTLFASGDSVTQAELVAPCRHALRLDREPHDPLIWHMLLLEQVRKRVQAFDLIHFHVDFLSFPLSRSLDLCQLATLHGRLDLPDLGPLYREFADTPVVSISDAQRDPLPWIRWAGTVHHGLPPDLLPFQPGPGRYLAFLGRISPEKRVDRAIAVARELDLPLRIAAKVDTADRDYYASTIRPLLRDPRVEFLGELGETEKAGFLGGATALLFPIDWPEPFGLVMIEALACGTPVVAWRRGSTPEVIEDGVTGFLVDDLAGAVAATARASSLGRERCRQEFERRFTSARMATDYLAIYRRLIAGRNGRTAQAAEAH